MAGFRWRSWLGASVLSFLLYGGVNFVGAVIVPIGLINDGSASGTLVLNPDNDAYLVGGNQAIAALRHDNPKLDTLLVSSMAAMCSQMMVYSILTLLVTWFAVRRHQVWAVWTVTLAAVAQVPYYVVITNLFADQGAFDHSFYRHWQFYLFLLVRNLIFLAVIGFVLAMIGRWREAGRPIGAGQRAPGLTSPNS